MSKFVDIFCIGAENRGYDLLVNVDDIARLHHNDGSIEFKTPFPDGTKRAIMDESDFEQLAAWLREL